MTLLRHLAPVAIALLFAGSSSAQESTAPAHSVETPAVAPVAAPENTPTAPAEEPSNTVSAPDQTAAPSNGEVQPQTSTPDAPPASITPVVDAPASVESTPPDNTQPTVPNPPRNARAVILLPFENASNAESATRDLEPLVAKEIEARGWTVMQGESIESVLAESRVRYLDSLEPAVRNTLAAKSGAAAFVLGTIYTYRDEEQNPVVAISARMITADGEITWGDVAAVTGSDTEAILGLGRKKSAAAIAKLAVDDLFGTFPRAGGGKRLPRGPRHPVFRLGPDTFRSVALADGRRHRICVLPFDSVSPDRVAARVVSDVLTIRLVASRDFDLVEPAELRAAMREEGIRTFRGIGHAELERLAKRVGTPLFLRGTIYEYRDTPPRTATVPTQIQLELTLVDVETSRIVWTAHHIRNGDDYRGFLMLGAASNAVSLTDRVVSELISAEQHSKPKGRATQPKVAKGDVNQ